MSKQLKTIFLSVALTGFIFSSTTAFAGSIYPGITDSCEQLWLVNDPSNPNLLPNEGGECIDVPAHLKKVKVLFNLDNAVTKTSPSVVYEKDPVTGKDTEVKKRWGVDDAPKPELVGTPMFVMVTEPVGLRHMALLGKVMQYRISQGLIEPSNVEIVGIFHGPAMSQGKWPFAARPFTAGGMPPEVKKWVHKIFALKNAGINIQLEVCGVTLKGMQLKMKKKAALTGQPIPWHLMDERAIYSHVHDDDDTDNGLDNATGRIYVNQGAVGRMIELQQHDFAYLQEE